MTKRDIVVIGASSGGIEALKTIVAGMPEDFPASVFIVLHTSPHGPGLLPEILARAGRLPASNAQDFETISKSHIYVAPPDRHLIVERGHVRVTRGPKENRTRPAIDPLFRSAALAYGTQVIGVILTGNLDDGTAGLYAIKAGGGFAVVQNPNTAFAPSMPLSALKNVEVDQCLALEEIAPALVRLTTMSPAQDVQKPMSELIELEVKIAMEEKGTDIGIMNWGEPSNFSCPECHGVLLQLKEGGFVRFRCHTGHAYTANNLLAEISEGIEEALWNAVRTMDEYVFLLSHMAKHFVDDRQEEMAAIFIQKAEQARLQAGSVTKTIMQLENVNIEDVKSQVK